MKHIIRPIILLILLGSSIITKAQSTDPEAFYFENTTLDNDDIEIIELGNTSTEELTVSYHLDEGQSINSEGIIFYFIHIDDNSNIIDEFIKTDLTSVGIRTGTSTAVFDLSDVIINENHRYGGFALFNTNDDEQLTSSITITIEEIVVNNITDFHLDQQTSEASINNVEHSVNIEVEYGTNVTSLFPQIEISAGATISPLPNIETDFTSAVTYTVTSEVESVNQDWTVNVTVAPPNTETDILDFSLENIITTTDIDIINHTIVIEAFPGTDLTTVIPSITLSEGATISPEGNVETDFSEEVTYIVTAQDDNSTQEWTVNAVSPILAFDNPDYVTGKEIGIPAITPITINYALPDGQTVGENGFAIGIIEFEGSDVIRSYPSINPDIVGTQSGSGTIDLELTDFIPNSEQLDPGHFYSLVAQITTNNGEHLVLRSDNIVVVEANYDADIIDFYLEEQTEEAEINTLTQTINIEVTHGTNLTALTPTLLISENATISPDPSIPQDFSDVFTYTVYPQNVFEAGLEWDIVVTEADNTEADITNFELTNMLYPAIIDDVLHTVSIEIARGTDITSLIPNITISEDATISPSMDIAQDFSTPVVYTVTAEDGTNEQDWTVEVDIPFGVLSFENNEFNTGLEAVNNSPLEVTVNYNLDAGEVIGDEGIKFYLLLGNGQDIEELFSLTDTSLSGTQSGSSSVNFDFSELTPTSELPDEQYYSIGILAYNDEDETIEIESTEITIRAASDKTEITSFLLNEQTDDAVINNLDHTISIEVVNGTDLTNLSPTIVVSEGASISPGSAVMQNFTNAVTYTVTAENNLTTLDWIVTVTEKPSNQTDILSFVFSDQTKDAVINDQNHTISIEVAYGTDLTILTPEITVSEGASISPNSNTNQNFSDEVTYTVTAENNVTTQDWIVSVTEAPNDKTNILGFVLAKSTGSAIIDTDDFSITIEVESDVDLTAIIPTIAISEEATISPASGVIRNFSEAVTYTVTAENGSNQVWTITVTNAPSETITSIIEDTISTKLVAYPNPASDQVTIEGTLINSNTITINDLLGNQIIIPIIKNTINIVGLESGIYFIKLPQQQTIRFIKQ